MMTSQIESFSTTQQSPQYENETKRMKNIILETTVLDFPLPIFVVDKKRKMLNESFDLEKRKTSVKK